MGNDAVGVRAAFIATGDDARTLGQAKGTTILDVLDAHDEFLCRAVLRAVENGADEAEWLRVMYDTRSRLSARFFEHVEHVERFAALEAGKAP